MSHPATETGRSEPVAERAPHRRILLKSAEEIALMREAGRIAAEVLEVLRQAVQPGVTTGELDRLAETTIRRAGARPSFKGYMGFPASICTSVNREVVHGIPGSRVLRSGDIVGIDLGVWYRNVHADTAITLPVGRVGKSVRRLLRVTRESLDRGLAAARHGASVNDIGSAVQRHVEGHGYAVVRQLVGHGVGRYIHEAPEVPNFFDGRRRVSLRPGMTLAIEPMVNEGGPEVVTGEDGWTVLTADGSLSAHFEHTVAITEDGPLVLTAPPESNV